MESYGRRMRESEARSTTPYAMHVWQPFGTFAPSDSSSTVRGWRLRWLARHARRKRHRQVHRRASPRDRLDGGRERTGVPPRLVHLGARRSNVRARPSAARAASRRRRMGKPRQNSEERLGERQLQHHPDPGRCAGSAGPLPWSNSRDAMRSGRSGALVAAGLVPHSAPSDGAMAGIRTSTRCTVPIRKLAAHLTALGEHAALPESLRWLKDLDTERPCNSTKTRSRSSTYQANRQAAGRALAAEFTGRPKP